MGSKATIGVVVAVCLCLAGATLSGILLAQHYGETWAVSTVKENCGDGQSSGCEEVAQSSWSSIAGIPVAAYGLVFYFSIILLLILSFFAPSNLRSLLAAMAITLLILGLLVDLALLGLQAFLIHAYCTLCIYTYLLSAGSLAVLIPSRRPLKGTIPVVRNPEGRMAFAGWILGTLAIMASVLGFNAMLSARAANRQTTLLGTISPAPRPAVTPAKPPVPEPPALPAPSQVPSASKPAVPEIPPVVKSPAPVSSPKLSDEAKSAEYWEKQAKKLEETLEDPNKVEAYYQERSLREYEASTPVSINLDNVPFKGLSAAPVSVVVYSDFLCVYCRQLAAALSRFVPESDGRVRVYFKNYPLDRNCNDTLMGSTHPGSCNAALGGICAYKQGKFDAYHDHIFSMDIQDPQIEDIVRIGKEAGLDPTMLQSCLNDPQTKAVLAEQVAEGNKLGVHATPTVYVDGKKLPRISDFVTIVDMEARKKGFKPIGQ